MKYANVEAGEGTTLQRDLSQAAAMIIIFDWQN
jgi:hypothetical protein